MLKVDLPQRKQKDIIKPFDHLKERNLIEYKSLHEVLNEQTFRNYVSRALNAESCEKISFQNKTTLTVLTTRKPISLLKNDKYIIIKINEWKYRSYCMPDLDVFIIVIKGMRNIKGGEALALLQILEANKDQQIAIWEEIFQQNLDNINELKNIAEQIDKGKIMNLVEELKKEGKIEGEIKGRIDTYLKMLNWMAPEIEEN